MSRRRPNPNAVPNRFRPHPSAAWLTLGAVGSDEAAQRLVAKLMQRLTGEYEVGGRVLSYRVAIHGGVRLASCG